MIAALRRQRTGRSRWDGRSRRYVSAPQRWTDEQIRGMFGMSKREFERALATVRTATPWTQEAMARQVLRFALRHKRWPTAKELDGRRKQLNLPPRSSMGAHFPGGRWPQLESPFAQLVRHIVQTPVLATQLTPQLVLSIRNVTVRREAMERFGMERLVREGGGELVQEDEYGKLWRLPTDNPVDQHGQWVEVVNATPEPDGTNAHYFLRVPPTVDTAREAVAWTFAESVTNLDIKMAS